MHLLDFTNTSLPLVDHSKSKQFYLSYFKKIANPATRGSKCLALCSALAYDNAGPYVHSVQVVYLINPPLSASKWDCTFVMFV